MVFTYDNVADLEISATNIDIANATLEHLGEFFVRNFILLKRATNVHSHARSKRTLTRSPRLAQ